MSVDMLDPEPCDLIVPPRWRSSIAVFRHDPPDEFQPLPHSRVSYLKVCVTLAPFAPELEVKLGRRAADMLEEAFPCHGALLHVTVSPPEEDRGGDRRDFPYFADFEPKKRELYEMVSETGEVLSGSSSTLAVGKSSASTHTTENYNIDNGWNFGTNFSYAGTGGGGQVGVQKQEGTVQTTGYQTSNVHMRDESVERRELTSHTTQLARMYNLFQAFHVGTNRALFLMEPRPYIRQSEATFINGPRALEGIQEVFLAVVRPRDTASFCVGALRWRFEEGKIKGGEREDIYHHGALDVDVVVKLRSKQAEVKEYVRSLFLSLAIADAAAVAVVGEDIIADAGGGVVSPHARHEPVTARHLRQANLGTFWRP